MAVIPKNHVSLLTFSSNFIFDEFGRKIKVASLWENQTIIFIFLRHFGCISCRAHAAQVWNDRAKYEKNGAKIVFVGNGSPDYIMFFKESLNITDAIVYTDPSLESFQSVGFKRGFLVALGPRSLINGFKLNNKGYKQGPRSKGTGDLWQLGGVLVVKPTGAVAYHYISQATGDFPPEKDLVGF